MKKYIMYKTGEKSEITREMAVSIVGESSLSRLDNFETNSIYIDDIEIFRASV